jgi:hypothetical protein
MKTLFDDNDRASIQKRIEALTSDTNPQWGKMKVAQMLTHCAIPLEEASGSQPVKQSLMGKVLTPFIRTSLLGEKPFKRNSPTSPNLVIADDRDFLTEHQRLMKAIEGFAKVGPDTVAKATHRLFGTLSGKEWGEFMYKHLDHHLQQFGV